MQEAGLQILAVFKLRISLSRHLSFQIFRKLGRITENQVQTTRLLLEREKKLFKNDLTICPIFFSYRKQIIKKCSAFIKSNIFYMNYIQQKLHCQERGKGQWASAVGAISDGFLISS